MVVMGTRPQIIKTAPLVWAMNELGLDYRLVLTKQHYDYELCDVFFRDLQLPKPDYILSVPAESVSHATQTHSIMVGVEEAVSKIEPSLLVVRGDTNTTLASALAGLKHTVPIAHVEAGVRSFDFRMAEEHNRRLTDQVSSLLFAATGWNRRNLEAEKVSGEVFVTGNTVMDAVKHYFTCQHNDALDCDLPEEFILATVHRAENVDDPSRLRDIVEMLTNLPLPLPVKHPSRNCSFSAYCGSR